MFVKAVALGALVCILTFKADTIAPAGHTWYVDCGRGDDAANGRTPSTAWKSVQAVNGLLFHPGDSIYFRRGSACTGMLAPHGSGTPLSPIHLDAWGTGPLPQIRAQSGQEAALKLFDQEYWTVRHLEFSGGNPHGIFASGTKGVLHGIHLSGLVVHDVTGEPKNKESGLVVIAAGTEQQHFDDVLIDGVTAYRTSQWAGILVGRGFPPEASRNTNVVIRNSIVHDVAGDGIVLFQVNNGLIEKSVAWLTGMQATETIGTPNAIWTWMCRSCTVRQNEAFLTDSPGVDGGAFDIDYGNDENVLEENYGHDTQGYCFAVFAAGWATTNSIVRNNVCVSNGLSPRLARRQGAVYLSTWNNGKIDGLEISNNLIFWKPSVASAPVVNIAEFLGKGRFQKNTVRSCSPSAVVSNPSLVFHNNSYEHCRPERPLEPSLAPPQRARPNFSVQSEHGKQVRACRPARGWCLMAFVSANEDRESRGQIAIIESIHRQFPKLEMQIVATEAKPSANLRYDWNAGDIPLLFDSGEALSALGISKLPAIVLTNPSGKQAWLHEAFTPPGDLGLLLRSLLGDPQYPEMSPDR